MRVIMPKSPLLDARAIRRALENTLTGAARSVKVDFDVTTQTWRERPRFKITRQPMRRVVSTDSKTYLYVTRGTKPHVIRAKHAPFLAFQAPGFRPKTRPRYIGSNKGAEGEAWVRARRVRHPGTKAREFEQVIGQKWQKQLPALLQRAIDAEVARR